MRTLQVKSRVHVFNHLHEAHMPAQASRRAAEPQRAKPFVNPAELPYCDFEGASLLLGNASESYVRMLIEQRVISPPVRLPGGRGRRLFHVQTLIRELDELRARQHAQA